LLHIGAQTGESGPPFERGGPTQWTSPDTESRPTDQKVAGSKAHTFFRLNASEGYVVAGGAALVASDLIRRPTQDLDLFTSAPVVSVTAAKESFLKALSRRR
jgi:hypothetical protein